MGITAAALSAALIGQGTLRQDAAFKGAIDGVKNQLRQVQNEATHTISGNLANGGKTGAEVFGKQVEFSPGSSTMTTWTLVASRQDGQVAGLNRCNPETSNIQNGMVYDPAAAAKKSVIFTRSPEKLWVAPDNAVANPTPAPTSAPGCDAASPVDPDPAALGPQNPCSGTAIFERPDGQPQGLCRDQPPPQPSITAYDSGGTALPNPGSTAGGYVDIRISTLGDSWELWVDGAKFRSGVPAGYPIRYDFSDNRAHSFYAYAFSGNSPPSQRSNTLTINQLNVSACSAAGSLAQGFVCGLKGEYFRGSGWVASNRQTVAIDSGVGSSLGGGESSYTDFLPTLRKRTGQRFSQNDSVQWTGEFFADAGVDRLCAESAGGTATLRAGTNGASSANGSTNGLICVGVTPGWQPITLKFSRYNLNTWLEGTARVRLISPAGAEISGQKLRVYFRNNRFSDGSTLSGPPFTPGLWASYYSGLVYGTRCCGSSYTYASGEFVPGIGSAGSPATYYNWNPYLVSRTGGNYYQGMSAFWFGYFYAPVSGYYSFQTFSDDTSGVYMPDAGGWLVWDQGGRHAPQWSSPSPSVWLSAGQHWVQLHNEDDCLCGSGNLTTFMIYYSYGGSGYSQVPNSWFSYSRYYTAQNLLPTFKLQDIAKNIRDQAAPARSGSKNLGQRLVELLLPQTALALSGSFDNNLLNPYNYQAGSLFDTGGSLRFVTSGDSSRSATINLNNSNNTISRSIP